MFTEKDLELMKNMADDLERFMETEKSYIIIQGLTRDEYESAVATVNKLIKRLRKGKGEKVFDMERFRTLKEEGKLDYRGM